MTLAFFSNYFNHHQKALCDEWFKLLGEDFTFVETEPMEEFRTSMGWEIKNVPSYVLEAHKGDTQKQKAMELANSCDVVIIGSAPETFVEQRIKNNRLTFRYTERPLKEGIIKMFIPRLAKKFYRIHYKNRNKNLYLLGASAFASNDYRRLSSYPDKCYKFGYFPFIHVWDMEELMEKKRENKPLRILWAGRFLKLKRADLLIEAAKGLKKDHIPFAIRIIGNGEEENKLKALVIKYGLEECISFCGFLSPEEVRKEMEAANIYVMTSNFLEGWGSVIYEGLSAGCAVVASHSCGSTPWLIQSGKNGYVFKNGDSKSLQNKLKRLLLDRELTELCGRNAYQQMQNLWNPEIAAKRVVEFSESIRKGHAISYQEGPLSKAPIIKNNWYKE